jgi:hypothetical protein
MQVKNYYGDIQTCVVCNSEDIEKYYTYTPPFADAINSRRICGCKDHVKEAHQLFLDKTSQRMNTLMMSSGS